MVRAPLSIPKTIKEMQKMIRMYEKQSAFTARQVLAVIIALILMSAFLPSRAAVPSRMPRVRKSVC